MTEKDLILNQTKKQKKTSHITKTEENKLSQGKRDKFSEGKQDLGKGAKRKKGGKETYLVKTVKTNDISLV